ncbi:MAG: GtrA family protein [Bacteroidetes bacterium]|nr:GtrA family protein [Bacteroidota bacterium]
MIRLFNNQWYMFKISSMNNCFFQTNPNFFEFVRFGIVGITALFIQYGVYYFLMQFMNVNIAYTLGYLISLIVNFVMTLLFTFKVKANAKRGAGFIFSHVCNYLLQLGLLNLFLYWGLSKIIAPVPVYIISIPFNFFMVRFFVKK